jgi:hypothetical protein
VGKHRAAFLIASALLATACGTSKSATPGTTPTHPGAVLTTPTTLRAPTTSTTTTTPAYSFDDSVPPPKLINTGTNYVAILKSLEDYSNWLAAHRPDPSLVDSFVAAGTRLHDSYVRSLAALRNRSERFIEVRAGADRYRIVSATADAISADVIQNITEHRVVDAAGHTIDQARFNGNTTYRVLAVRTGGHWFVASTVVAHAPLASP